MYFSTLRNIKEKHHQQQDKTKSKGEIDLFSIHNENEKKRFVGWIWNVKLFYSIKFFSLPFFLFPSYSSDQNITQILHSFHNSFLWKNEYKRYKADWGMDPYRMEGNLLIDSRRSGERFEIWSLANWLIIFMWQLNAFPPPYSQEMYKLPYFRIMTSNLTNGSNHFLLHRNMTERQCENEVLT